MKRRQVLQRLTGGSVFLTAGCSGLPGTDQRTPTPQPTVENFSYPSGWSQEGITDLTVALRTNDETVRNVSRKSRLVRTDEDSNRTIVRVLYTDAGVGSVRLIDTQFDADIHRYYSTNGVFEYDRTTDELEHMSNENWMNADVATVEGLTQPLRSLELNATETVTVGERAAVRYVVSGIRNPDSVPADTATGHITVVENGHIAEINITRGNEKFTKQTVYELSAFENATVTRPAWMSDK